MKFLVTKIHNFYQTFYRGTQDECNRTSILEGLNHLPYDRDRNTICKDINVFNTN